MDENFPSGPDKRFTEVVNESRYSIGFKEFLFNKQL